MKNRLDGNSYLVIVRQAFFNKNSDETLLTEDNIDCNGVKVFSRPRVFGGNQLVEARYQVGRIVNLGISWDGSTRYLNISPPNRADVERLSSLHITTVEPYFTYSPLGKSTMQFKLNDPFPERGRVKIIWTNYKIQECRQRLGYVSSHIVNKTFENSIQNYPGVRNEREVMPNNSAVEIFPGLSDPF